ncbi:MAG TPA: YfiR family protein [Planctomycetota bacterium]|nr:YfiR family protein [Planctomycetota bacterium]
MTFSTLASALRGRTLVARPLRRLRAERIGLRPLAWVGKATRRALVVATGVALAHIALPPRETSARAAVRAAPEQSTGEYDLKAQFMLRFATPYVKWPETAFDDKASPFLLAILGKDPFGKSLEEILKEKKVGEHPIQIVHFATVDTLGNCHMLFVPAAHEKQLVKIAQFNKDRPVLIVAESIAAAQSGAHVGFYLEKSRVRFAINATAAKRAKLEVSSELLKLAKLVDNKAERDP